MIYLQIHFKDIGDACLPKTPLDYAVEAVESKWGSVANPNADLSQVHKIVDEMGLTPEGYEYNDKTGDFVKVNGNQAGRRKHLHIIIWHSGKHVYTNNLALSILVKKLNLGQLNFVNGCATFHFKLSQIYKLRLHHHYYVWRSNGCQLKGLTCRYLLNQCKWYFGAPKSRYDLTHGNFDGVIIHYNYYTPLRYKENDKNDHPTIEEYFEE